MRWVVAALAVVQAASAGEIRIKVKGATPDDVDRVVGYVVQAPEVPAPKEAIRVSQKNARFNPSLLVVQKGTTVDFTNDDWVTHNVFSKSPAKAFDLGLYAKGEKQVVTFDTEGVIDLFCSIHPRMTGAVLVLQNPYFAKVDASGVVKIANVPAGDYQVRVYKLGAPEAKPVPVKVQARGIAEIEMAL